MDVTVDFGLVQQVLGMWTIVILKIENGKIIMIVEEVFLNVMLKEFF